MKRTGIPMSPKIAFSGSVILSPKEEINSDKRASEAPISITAGSINLWSPVPNIFLAMWGTKTPKKATGPQKEVTSPARSAVKRIRRNFIFSVDRPELRA